MAGYRSYCSWSARSGSRLSEPVAKSRLGSIAWPPLDEYSTSGGVSRAEFRLGASRSEWETLKWMRLLVAALILPAVIVLALATFETRIFYPLPSNGPVRGIVWSGHTFPTRTDFAHWLRSKGVPYRVWARRHPVWAGLTSTRSDKHAVPHRTAAVRDGRQKDSGWPLGTLVGGAAFLAILGVGIAFIRLRLRRGSGAPAGQSLEVAVRRGAAVAEEGARLTRHWTAVTAQHCLALAATATVSARRRRGELAWYLGTVLLAVGVGLMVTVWLNGA